jgi:hypothetical protein
MNINQSKHSLDNTMYKYRFVYFNFFFNSEMVIQLFVFFSFKGLSNHNNRSAAKKKITLKIVHCYGQS